MCNHEVVRLINEGLFLVNVDECCTFQQDEYVEVLSVKSPHTILAQVCEVYEKYVLCMKMETSKVFYGEKVRSYHSDS
ncbi:hypothetical protein ACYCJG_05140 [Staphylococcus chromogenes]|uniref:Uncharacterized protein n=1 Tax=Staphylococcus chromogenes TaxID=46126 RepID=A0ABD5AXY1_STACR|nr:hypothetical protein [Staphylococcus chromogenes]MDQ7176151.1 hypothetical protein [Staphylococcus chromogenes]PTF32450.1 hypothetical protein BUY14_00510 [Staphylococcus chromogenes]PTF84491.1 hypothetical protein BU677_05635 [Staphylococcus chromogenes]PTF87344.1 hypothetical protein BU659_05110 [Staphylococcus chromogenes]PTF99892.1 hypothetical protein BU663_06860 [Staphylococcus chromogenes]